MSASTYLAVSPVMTMVTMDTSAYMVLSCLQRLSLPASCANAEIEISPLLEFLSEVKYPIAWLTTRRMLRSKIQSISFYGYKGVVRSGGN
jgi:hypothetical protein